MFIHHSNLSLSKVHGEILCCKTQANCATGIPTAVPEPPPAVGNTLQVDPPYHISRRQSGTSTASQVEERTGACSNPGRGKQSRLHDGKTTQDGLGVVLMPQRNGFDAGLGVVLDVLVGVDHVVQDGPRNVGAVQTGGRIQRVGVGHQIDSHGREAHDGAPGEGEAEHCLRVVGDPFGQGVRRDEQQRRHGVEEALRWELQQHGQAGEEL